MPEQKIRVFVDTSFLIRLLKEDDPLHQNAKDYIRYILDNSGSIFCSSIAIAEYCVKGTLDELPLEFMHVIPFNIIHAVKAGEFASMCFDKKVEVAERVIIPNDCKLLAQAEVEKMQYFLTSDRESRKIYEVLHRESIVTYQFIDIRIPFNETFGVLSFSA